VPYALEAPTCVSTVAGLRPSRTSALKTDNTAGRTAAPGVYQGACLLNICPMTSVSGEPRPRSDFGVRYSMRNSGGRSESRSAPRLTEIEICHISNPVGGDIDGAHTICPGPFLLHAVGGAPLPQDRRVIEHVHPDALATSLLLDTG
jgi:hypothetical protein